MTTLFETTAVGGIFTLEPWSILGIFRGTGATSVLERLGAHSLDGDVVADFSNLILIGRFRTSLGVGVIAESADVELERKY